MTDPITPVIPGAARPTSTAFGTTAGLTARFPARRPLPLPTLVTRRTRDIRYGMATMDSGGRIGDRAILTALGWTPGTAVTAEPTDDSVILVYPAPGGRLNVASRGHLRVPAALRHRCGLVGGDRFLLAADLDTGWLRLYPPAALDTLLHDVPLVSGGKR